MGHRLTAARIVRTALVAVTAAVTPNFSAQAADFDPSAVPDGPSVHLPKIQLSGVPSATWSNPKASAEFSGLEMAPPETSRGGAAPPGVSPAQVFQRTCRAVTLVKTDESLGTGSVIDTSGYVLTAAHVVDGYRTVVVGLFPSCRPGPSPVNYRAQVIKVDDYADLALLKIESPPKDLSTISLGSIGNVQTGSPVLIIGNPHGLLLSMSIGMVSAIRPNHEWRASDGIQRKATVIQTDGAVNSGNSGGPMMDATGNIIGVNSFKDSEGAGLNFAVSVNEVRDFLRRDESRIATRNTVARAEQSKGSCEPKVVKEGRQDGGTVRLLDASCSGKIDFKVFVPDDAAQAIITFWDRNHDGDADVKFYDENRDGSPEYSLWDDDFDGEYEFRGEHKPGEWDPIRKSRV